MQNFEEAYQRQYPVLERAAAQLRALLRDIAAGIEDRKLVRAKIESVRIKELPSLKRKARKAGWDAETALHNCPDLVGGRVVCNNVEDVYRFAELIREQLSVDSGPVTRQDYIENPTPDGYRALHLNFRLNAAEGFAFAYVACEVQIRSRLQDAWAELSHGDIYKQDRLPQDLRDRAKDLSRLLATADETATEIRARAARVTEPPKARPRLDRVSAGVLAYIFKDVFGRAPADYIVTEALNRADELGVSVLTDLPATLRREDFRGKLAEAYSALIPVPLPAEVIFLAGLHALARDESRAVRYVRAQAQQEFDEIDAFYRREMLSILPDTADALIEELEGPGADGLSYAEALGAAHDCARSCGTPVVEPYAFAEAATRHYELDGDEADRASERIIDALYRSATETGGFDDESYCSYCADQIAKDD